jgi:hypothetical protein
MIRLCDLNDVDWINEILNDAAVSPWIVGSSKSRPDAAPALRAENAKVLTSDAQDGAVLFVLNDTTAELHVAFRPQHHDAAKTVSGACQWLFAHTGVSRITTPAPRANKKYVALLDRGGFDFDHTSGEWEVPTGPTPFDHYILKKAR